jgi:hypothetical protein
MSEIVICSIGGGLCLIGLAWLGASGEWNKRTKPPKGWVQHNGVRIKMHKPKQRR